MRAPTKVMVAHGEKRKGLADRDWNSGLATSAAKRRKRACRGSSRAGSLSRAFVSSIALLQSVLSEFIGRIRRAAPVEINARRLRGGAVIVDHDSAGAAGNRFGCQRPIGSYAQPHSRTFPHRCNPPSIRRKRSRFRLRHIGIKEFRPSRAARRGRSQKLRRRCRVLHSWCAR